MIVVNRFRVPPADEAGFAARVAQAHDALAARPGYLAGTVGRNLDDPSLWLLTTTWADVGSYRRALSSYDVKVAAVPVLAQAIDEPFAYEPVGPGPLNEARPRGDRAAEASGTDR